MWLVPVLGNAAVSRSYACMAGGRARQVLHAGELQLHAQRRRGQREQQPDRDRPASPAGARSAGRSTAGQNRGGAAARAGLYAARSAATAAAPGAGRPSGRAWPAAPAARSASRVTATATTRIEPTARDEKTTSPASSSPAIEMITAMPETTTACPEVSAAISTASRCGAALGPFLAFPADVEQRVVDPDRHADQQDHAGGGVGGRHQVRGESGQAHRGGHRRERQQHRHAGRDQRAERDDAGWPG